MNSISNKTAKFLLGLAFFLFANEQVFWAPYMQESTFLPNGYSFYIDDENDGGSSQLTCQDSLIKSYQDMPHCFLEDRMSANIKVATDVPDGNEGFFGYAGIAFRFGDTFWGSQITSDTIKVIYSSEAPIRMYLSCIGNYYDQAYYTLPATVRDTIDLFYDNFESEGWGESCGTAFDAFKFQIWRTSTDTLDNIPYLFELFEITVRDYYNENAIDYSSSSQEPSSSSSSELSSSSDEPSSSSLTSSSSIEPSSSSNNPDSTTYFFANPQDSFQVDPLGAWQFNDNTAWSCDSLTGDFNFDDCVNDSTFTMVFHTDTNTIIWPTLTYEFYVQQDISKASGLTIEYSSDQAIYLYLSGDFDFQNSSGGSYQVADDFIILPAGQNQNLAIPYDSLYKAFGSKTTDLKEIQFVPDTSYFGNTEFSLFNFSIENWIPSDQVTTLAPLTPLKQNAFSFSMNENGIIINSENSGLVELKIFDLKGSLLYENPSLSLRPGKNLISTEGILVTKFVTIKAVK